MSGGNSIPMVAGKSRSEAAAAPNWWADYAADFARYRAHRRDASALVLLVTEQGLWALLIYRVARAARLSLLPRPLTAPLRLAIAIAEKVIEIITGITLPGRACIGPGLYIGHHGNVILHEDVVMGSGCNISQGVTIGTSGLGARRGVPRIGDRVYIATNAVVVGRIVVGDEAVVAANSLVTRNVEPRTTVMGVPARVVKRRGSAGYICAAMGTPQPAAQECVACDPV